MSTERQKAGFELLKEIIARLQPEAERRRVVASLTVPLLIDGLVPPARAARGQP